MPAFARVVRAREALQKEAESAVKLVKKAAAVAAKKGNHAPAAWMLEHTVAVNDEGKEIRPISSGIDRQQIEKGNGAPVINIGFLQAPNAPKQLEAVGVQVIEADAVESE